MKRRQEVTYCLNCSEKLSPGANFCIRCGQKVSEGDRSLARLLGSLFGNIFYIDSRLFVSIRSILTSPGKMSVEYLDGKRKKYISPVTLFLFVNLLFFLVNPISDYSLTLTDQINSQYYSEIGKEFVRVKVNEIAENNKVSFEEAMRVYSEKYNRTSDNISKSIMILNVPYIALFCYLMSFSARKYYFDSLIFSINFFSVFLLCVIIGNQIYDWVFSWITESPVFYMLIFIVVIPIIYLSLAFRRFTGFRWMRVLLSALFISTGLILTQGLYRLIVFVCTFLST